jgi:hypothetical protein
VGLYDQVVSPQDLEVVFAIEALTNPRVRQELGQLNLVPFEQRVVGPGATLIMAAFTHLNPNGSRFSDGTWGVYYASDSLHTAIAEVSHHRALFLARTREPAIDIDMRWIKANLMAQLHDLRGQGGLMPAVYDSDHYGPAQDLGRLLRAQNSAGVTFDSVRHPPGQCVGIFQPQVLSNARAAGHISLCWNGDSISHWFEKGTPHAT